MGQFGSLLLATSRSSQRKMLAIITITLLLSTLGNAYPQPQGIWQSYDPDAYSAYYTGASPADLAKQKERVAIIMNDIEEFIASIGDTDTSANFKAALPGIKSNIERTISNAASIPGSSMFQWLSDEEFEAFREKQQKIFKSSTDLSSLLGGLNFFSL